MGREIKFTKEKLIYLFHELEKEYGHQPTKRQWIENNKTPSDMPIRTHFGNWINFVKACGREPLNPAVSELARRNSINSRKGKKGGNNQGGIIKNAQGYIEIWQPDHPNANSKGYILEHRLIMSQFVGRKLESDEDVHHINGIKDDNRIENLQLLSKAEHISLHNKGVSKQLNYKNCEYPGCNEKTSGKYMLCRTHYKIQWQRMRAKAIENLHDFSKVKRIHSMETKKKLSESAKKQPRKNGKFSKGEN